MITLPAEGVNVTIKLLAGVPVTVRLADVSPSLPVLTGYPANINNQLRTGYGGGHSIDAMSLIQRKYTTSPDDPGTR